MQGTIDHGIFIKQIIISDYVYLPPDWTSIHVDGEELMGGVSEIDEPVSEDDEATSSRNTTVLMIPNCPAGEADEVIGNIFNRCHHHLYRRSHCLSSAELKSHSERPRANSDAARRRQTLS